VTRDLIRQGHEVTVVDIGGDGLLREIVGGDLGPQAIPPVVRLDANDLGGLLRLRQDQRFTAIAHLAGLLSVDCQRAPVQGAVTNVIGTASVFELARALGITRLVWAGTTAVFGHKSGPGGNGQPPFDPENFYAMYKVINEMQAQRYFTDFGLPSTGIRIAMGYGYGRAGGRSSWVRQLLANPALGQPAVVSGGDTQVPWCYIEDASSAIVHALGTEPGGCRIYTYAGDIRWKHEVAAFVTSVLPGSRISIVGPDESYPVSIADRAALEVGLGWLPAYSMERGVLATINRYRHAAGLPVVPMP
jgi:nucleoside-diphosphate-sugar epimerase